MDGGLNMKTEKGKSITPCHQNPAKNKAEKK